MTEEKKAPEVTVDNLTYIVKFLEELATQKRLTQAEIDSVKPHFDKIVSFLVWIEKQSSLHTAQTLTETSDEDIDITHIKSKKKNK